jgi:SAM-dependent methyltransferase
MRQGRYLLLDLADLRDKIARRSDPLRPPRRLILDIGGGNFEWIGARTLELLTTVAGLKPYDSVLEVGCGVGQIAIPLARYMDGTGRYEAFDIVEPFVRWCREHITPRFPNFHFQHADLYNTTYNRHGRTLARNYTFPFPASTFDLVYLTSVFTHMLPEDMTHYLHEIARVLKQGGRSLITFFLLNPESTMAVEAGKTSPAFPNAFDQYRTFLKDDPEAAIAYSEVFVRELYGSCGLEIVEPIHYGSWCGRTKCLGEHDFIVATKP